METPSSIFDGQETSENASLIGDDLSVSMLMLPPNSLVALWSMTWSYTRPRDFALDINRFNVEVGSSKPAMR